MRIALIVPGGVSRDGEHNVIPALVWLIERLARRHDVHVLVPRQEPQPGTWELRGATVHNLGRRRWRMAALRLLHRLHHARPFDVFQAMWGGGPIEVAWLASRLSGRPYVVHLGGGELVRMPELGFGARRPGRLMVTRFGVRNADVVTAASEIMIGLGRDAGASPERVPLGADLGTWIPEPPRPRSPGSPARIVQVASLTPVKDQGTLLRAVAALVRDGLDVHLDIVGVDALGGAVQRLAAELDVHDRVTFHGFLPQRRAVPVVCAAHVMVVSSRHEAGPVVMLEAAAMGVPTVGTDVGQLRDWAPDRAVAVPVGDPGALAAAVARLLSDEPERLALAARAQEAAVREDADWTAERFEAMYRRLTGGVDAERP